MTKNFESPNGTAKAQPEISLGEDLLRGADEIAKFMFGDVCHRRKIYYLTGEATKGLPHFKIGSLICARKSTILNWISEQESRS
ncbi:hypothetical protein [Paracoccus marcusii]|uniref:DNA-binding protein n=1 Tax=Paracoccus marcusii TaxID=59779 RepID=A0ABY7USE6_9RHOB|nr:hypothetical protein [Paracoccus marcusii]WDA11784.1 hypothetical protein PRL19_10800 [Paracoccus marcusii]